MNILFCYLDWEKLKEEFGFFIFVFYIYYLVIKIYMLEIFMGNVFGCLVELVGGECVYCY